MSSLLRDAIILDTETLGLERGAGLHELAFYDLQRRHVEAFVLNPNAVNVSTVPQETTKLSSTYMDKYSAQKFPTWSEALHSVAQRLSGKDLPPGMTIQALEKVSPWLASQLKHYPHLLAANNAETPASISARQKLFETYGITSNLNGKPVAVQDALGTLQQAMSGKTVWIANAAFESKQIGAQLGAMGEEAATAFKAGLETANVNSPDPFYVTGSEVTKARVLAQVTGDWTGVYEAYLMNAPKAGETAVRDIQDLTRALHSYGRKLGFISKDANYLGTGIDISHRMHAMAAGDLERVGMKELHRAAEDAALHEAYVLERNAKMLDALHEVSQATPRGRKLLSEGPDGILGQVANYFEALEAHGNILMEEQAVKRIQRAQQDFLDQGYTEQFVGGRPYAQAQLTPSGETVKAWRSQPTKKRMTSMEEVLTFLENQGTYEGYDVSIRDVYEEMQPHIQTKEDLAQYTYQRVSELQESYKTVQVGSGAHRLAGLGRRATTPIVGELAATVGKAASGRGAVFGGAAAVLTFMGAAASGGQTPPPPPESILHQGYSEWLEQTRIEGMSEGGVSQAQRHAMTDFGSPYRGPVGVEQVFMQQEMLAERERFLRAQYGVRHATIAVPRLPSFKTQSGYRFISGGERVRGEDYGMRGDLRKIDLTGGGWKVTAEDADTITVQRAGIKGALQSFFGHNQERYSFRLAGLDSPEIAHADRAAQPYADTSAQAFASMLANAKNLQLIYDPSQVTYGRMLGAVMADGKNLNYELVRQGLAAHLPYGKYSESIIDYSALAEAEARAYAAGRGMWSQPWSRSFYEHSGASGNRVTFNTLAKTESVVKNSGTMQMISAMEQAQADGLFTADEYYLAQNLGGKYNVGDDKVGPWSMTAVSSPTMSYMQEQLRDLSEFTRTKGRGNVDNKFSAKTGYRQLDKALVVDSMGTSTSPYSKRRLAAFGQYRSQKALDRARKNRMAWNQRKTLQAMSSSSPVQHHRM